MRVNTFQVVPRIPERLGRLREIALNLLWSWDEEVRSVFRRLDRDLWEQCSQDPMLMLARVVAGTASIRWPTTMPICRCTTGWWTASIGM